MTLDLDSFITAQSCEFLILCFDLKQIDYRYFTLIHFLFLMKPILYIFEMNVLYYEILLLILSPWPPPSPPLRPTPLLLLLLCCFLEFFPREPLFDVFFSVVNVCFLELGEARFTVSKENELWYHDSHHHGRRPFQPCDRFFANRGYASWHRQEKQLMIKSIQFLNREIFSPAYTPLIICTFLMAASFQICVHPHQ